MYFDKLSVIKTAISSASDLYQNQLFRLGVKQSQPLLNFSLSCVCAPVCVRECEKVCCFCSEGGKSSSLVDEWSSAWQQGVVDIYKGQQAFKPPLFCFVYLSPLLIYFIVSIKVKNKDLF